MDLLGTSDGSDLGSVSDNLVKATRVKYLCQIEGAPLSRGRHDLTCPSGDHASWIIERE